MQLTFGQREWTVAYRAALRVLKMPDQAEDAAQDALMRAYRARDSFAGRSHVDTWLYRIAYTTALGYLRRPHYYRRATPPGDHVDVLSHLRTLPSKDAGPEEQTSAMQLAVQLDECLETMRPTDRIAFTERFIRGTSERDLGSLLGVSTNAAKQRAFRARRAVRAHFTRRTSSTRPSAEAA